MPIIQVKLGPEPHWPELDNYELVKGELETGPVRELYYLSGDTSPPMQVARLSGGMVSGKSSVGIRIDLPDGRVVIAETSLALFTDVARLLAIRDEMESVRNTDLTEETELPEPYTDENGKEPT